MPKALFMKFFSKTITKRRKNIQQYSITLLHEKKCCINAPNICEKAIMTNVSFPTVWRILDIQGIFVKYDENVNTITVPATAPKVRRTTGVMQFHAKSILQFCEMTIVRRRQTIKIHHLGLSI